VRGTLATLLEVLANRGTATVGLPSVGHHRGGSQAAGNSLGSRLSPACLTEDGGLRTRRPKEVLVVDGVVA
jgi:hypothetical protein